MGELIVSIIFITLINIVLSGDNAVVIGLALRNVPAEYQKKAAFLASGLAVVLRVIFTIFAVYLLRINYLSVAGGALLIWITLSLMKSGDDEKKETKNGKKANNFWSAVWIIVIADLSMAFDNVMGVAGAANGSIMLVIFGLALSIPILIYGATWLAKVMEKYPIIIYLGAMVLMHTAVKMIIEDKALHLAGILGETVITLVPWIAAIPVLVYGIVVIKKAKTREARVEM